MQGKRLSGLLVEVVKPGNVQKMDIQINRGWRCTHPTVVGEGSDHRATELEKHLCKRAVWCPPDSAASGPPAFPDPWAQPRRTTTRAASHPAGAGCPPSAGRPVPHEGPTRRSCAVQNQAKCVALSSALVPAPTTVLSPSP